MIDKILEEIKAVLDSSRSIEWKNKNSKRTVLKSIKKAISPMLEDVKENVAAENELPVIKYGSAEVVQLHNKKSEFYRVMTSDQSAEGDPEHAHE